MFDATNRRVQLNQFVDGGVVRIGGGRR